MKKRVKDKSNLDVDLNVLFSLLWYNRFIIILFLLLSVPFALNSISKAKVLYRAESVIEIVDDSSASISQFPSLPTLLVPPTQKKVNIAPLIVGNKFLSKITELYDLEEKVSECRVVDVVQKPNPFSLAGILEYSGAFNVKAPLVSTTKQRFFDCLRGMIEIKSFEYRREQTSAYSIFVESENPETAAFLSNTIVEAFFQWEAAEKKKKYEKSQIFLSKTLSESQERYENKKRELDNFILSNPLAGKIPNETFEELSKLRDRGKKIEENIIKLETAIEGESYDHFVSADLTNPFSNEFIQVFRIEILNKDSEQINYSSLNRVGKKELERLITLLETNRDIIKTRESELDKKLIMAKKLNDFTSEVEFRAAFVQGLNQSITSKALETGLSSLTESLIYSQAVPPLYPIKPNPKFILVGFAISFLFFGALFAIFLQIKKQYIYSLSQLKIFESLSLKISLKEKILFSRDASNLAKNIGYNFLANLNDADRKLCFILGINEKSSRQGKLPDAVADALSVVSSNQGNKILLAKVDHERHKNFSISGNIKDIFEKKEDRSMLENQPNITAIEIEDNPKSIQTLNDMSKSGQFDKIFISVDSSFSEVLKHELLKKSDTYILIGSKGYCTIDNVDRYVLEDPNSVKIPSGLILVG